MLGACSCLHVPSSTENLEANVTMRFSSLPLGGSDSMHLRILQISPPLFIDDLGGTVNADYIRANVQQPRKIRVFCLDLRDMPALSANDLVSLLEVFSSSRLDNPVQLDIVRP